MTRASADMIKPALVAIATGGLLIGLMFMWAGKGDIAHTVFIAFTLPVLLALVIEIALSLRKGEIGLDIVAALSMTAAIVFDEELAAIVVALMYSGGQLLESFAEARARRGMTALLARAPRTAFRYQNDELVEIPLADIRPGDRLMVRKGDIVPVDGHVSTGIGVLDESTLTGESRPVRREAGDEVFSGTSNVGEPFDLVASQTAENSTVAGIVRLVEQAQQSRAPMTRLADRYAIGFLVLTLIIAGLAYILSGDPVRIVAVLVVATPCPLILAVPVALVAGLSRAASQGILIKGGKVLEAIAGVKALVIDKTGTLTTGRAALVSINSKGDSDAVLRLAAGLDQASQHTLARTIVLAAHDRGLSLPTPKNAAESVGEGIEGEVDGHSVIVGGSHFVARRLGLAVEHLSAPPPSGAIAVGVAIDGAWAGTLILADELRAGSAELLTNLRREGIEHIVLATGDTQAAAEATAAHLPLDYIHAAATPEQKMLIVVAERKYGPVMMVGDGVNDAPALATADIGVAMGAHGSAASAETANMVILVDAIDRVLPGIRIAKRSKRIALQSVYAGIGLSVAFMAVAAAGYLLPVEGALVQEAIDVAVILNAMRALR